MSVDLAIQRRTRAASGLHDFEPAAAIGYARVNEHQHRTAAALAAGDAGRP